MYRDKSQASSLCRSNPYTVQQNPESVVSDSINFTVTSQAILKDLQALVRNVVKSMMVAMK